jgi:hypothetical protein
MLPATLVTYGNDKGQENCEPHPGEKDIKTDERLFMKVLENQSVVRLKII